MIGFVFLLVDEECIDFAVLVSNGLVSSFLPENHCMFNPFIQCFEHVNGGTSLLY